MKLQEPSNISCHFLPHPQPEGKKLFIVLSFCRYKGNGALGASSDNKEFTTVLVGWIRTGGFLTPKLAVLLPASNLLWASLLMSFARIPGLTGLRPLPRLMSAWGQGLTPPELLARTKSGAAPASHYPAPSAPKDVATSRPSPVSRGQALSSPELK